MFQSGIGFSLLYVHELFAREIWGFPAQRDMGISNRLMTMSPLYPCGIPCSIGTHNETVKNLALFSSIINGIAKESQLRISITWECFQYGLTGGFSRLERLTTMPNLSNTCYQLVGISRFQANYEISTHFAPLHCNLIVAINFLQ